MIDVMLIDDDVSIRDYLRDVILWENLGLRLSCEAGDSETARELYQLHRPKIVVMDINIPIISGLELAKEFVAMNRDVCILVITGYGDFDNVRDSVNVGAIDLLAKPIVPAEINASLRHAVDRFTQMRRRYRTQQALSELLTENQGLLQERCVTQLFTRPPEGGEAKILKQFELLSLSFPNQYYGAVLIYLEEEPSGDLGGAAFPTAFKKMCETTFLSNGFRIFSCFGVDDCLYCLANWSFDRGDERMEAMLEKLLEETRFYFQAGFSAYMGSPVEQLSDLYRSAEQARLSRRLRDDSFQGIVNYRNIGQLTPSCDTSVQQILETLVEYAQTFRRQEFRALLDKLCGETELEQLREFSLELLSQLSGLCFQSGAYPWNSVNYPGTIACIFDTASQEAVKNVLGKTCERLLDVLMQQRNKSKNHLISMAKSYIHEHLGDSGLSLDTVSLHVGLSKIYFCQLFHKEEGISFNAYLNGERIAQAKTLLLGTGKKVFEISDEIGYSNPKYFNYVFKHAVGVTPLEYRKTAGLK
ncbi:MAG: AraC family transcriptional regulator [Lachnospiraceae bacterium]|nr:AraC family transcriptional regulator [Lachnospiraceae bacterium]